MSDETPTTERTEPLVEGQVFYAKSVAPIDDGTAALYVRTEAGETGGPVAVFVLTRGRIVLTRSTPLDRVADEWDLSYTPSADGVAAAVELSELRAERAGLVAAMKLAVELEPTHAQQLRNAYQKAKR